MLVFILIVTKKSQTPPESQIHREGVLIHFRDSVQPLEPITKKMADMVKPHQLADMDQFQYSERAEF